MEEILYYEIYRPKSIEEMILPKEIKKMAEGIIETKTIPNLLFHGKSGTGKTTLAQVLCDTLGYDVLRINASNEGRALDVVRNDIMNFATGISLSGNKKVVILDEFCGCTNIVQDALKAFFEEYSSTCSFILTANHKHKISDAILSRFSDIEFKIPQDEKQGLGIEMMKRILFICSEQGIKADKLAIAELVKKYFPDFRKILNELQKFSISKQFTMDSLKALETPITQIVKHLKDKNFKELHILMSTTSNLDIIQINRQIMDSMFETVQPQSIPVLTLLLADWNYKSAFSQDMLTCIMGEFVEIMSNVEFK